MPIQKILLTPGINTQPTQTLNSAGWSTSNLIRWRNGLAEKIGGWTKLITTALTGVCRGMHIWQDLSFNDYIVCGTNSRLELFNGGELFDITPIVKTSNLSSPFTTVINTATVTVHDVAHGAAEGDYINIFMTWGVGGVVLQGYYEIITVVDADNYTILAATNATSSTGTGHAPQFTTVMTSSTVTVTLPNYNLAINAEFDVQVSTVVGGLTFFGTYLVQTTPTANTFTITGSGGAGSSASGYENADTAIVQYLLPSGGASDIPLVGWGAGKWGSGTWGSSVGGSAFTPLRIWWLDNFGENLIAVPSGGKVYQWVPPLALGNVATILTNAPIYNNAMFIATPQQQIVVLGSETGSVQDPLLIRWSDTGVATVWTATSTNQAGSYRLSRGSTIVGGIQAPQAGLVWTDIDLWTMQYIQPPYIYAFNMVGTGCGLIAPKAFAILARNTFFLSYKGFFVFSDGGVQALPCAVWDVIFKDLDNANVSKCFGAANSLFNEVSFFYPSLTAGTGEISAYVKYNAAPDGGQWDYGQLVRTAWIDENLFGFPMGVDGNAYIQQHEIGYNADTIPMAGVEIESGYADISDGTQFMFVDWIIPDFLWTGSTTGSPSLQLTVYSTDFPGTTPNTYGPYTVTPQTQYITLRTRARQMAFKIQSDTDGTFWRTGAIRYRGVPAGAR